MADEHQGFLVDYRAKLEDRIDHVRKFLGDGKCPSFEEYKKLTGQIRGMEFAIDDMKDILAKYQTDSGEIDNGPDSREQD